MDAKITLSFNADVIDSAKEFAEKHNMSLSRLTEYLYSKLTKSHFYSLEDLPLTDWVNMVSEGQAEYVITRKTKAAQKKEFYESGKKKKK